MVITVPVMLRPAVSEQELDAVRDIVGSAMRFSALRRAMVLALRLVEFMRHFGGDEAGCKRIHRDARAARPRAPASA